MPGLKILRRFKTAKVSIKNLTSNVNYEVEIDDIFLQKAKDVKELNSFIENIINLSETQSKQKALDILDKQSQSFINKFTTVLNGITEAIQVIQTGSKIFVKPSSSDLVDHRTDEDVVADINKKYVWAKEEEVK